MDTLCVAPDRGGIALTGLCCCFSDQRQQATSKMTGYVQQPAVRGGCQDMCEQCFKGKVGADISTLGCYPYRRFGPVPSRYLPDHLRFWKYPAAATKGVNIPHIEGNIARDFVHIVTMLLGREVPILAI
ncbi:unnamed protein product [Tuber melanosporum]|uniref:(Perigord truffle) hypothetical protein n=1 Tax=Tuber melanosporum (strain Mel28) TaxID=656061 RepID=D5GHF0_TUBMM|nr:uncharacterized protein GSTUM_00007900001 [Tuber melanosporum]CAZ83943.1 unnamed protein product [Tuber melanosporum]